MSKLAWKKEYAIDKFLPLFTRWHLMYDDNLQANISMDSIIKKRVNKGIRCYEIKWNNYELVTIEPQLAVQKRYPKVVSSYEDMHSNSSNKPKKKSNHNFIFFNYINIKSCKTFIFSFFFSVTVHNDALIDVTNKLSSMNISKKNVKIKKNSEVEDKCSRKGPLDRFIIQKKNNEDSLTLSDFECDSVNLDLSTIINEIITK